MPDPSIEVLTFGPFRLDLSTYKLMKAMAGNGLEQPVAMRPKAFDVLRYLVKNAGRTISPDEFLSELWPGVYVQPEVLKGYVLAVRAALDDRTLPPTYIETVRGRGYRFIAPVRSQVAQHVPDRDRRLVGRKRCRAELDAAMARAVAGEAQVVFLTGDAGIGKTALTTWFAEAASAAGTTVLIGHCLPGSGPTDAFYPVIEVLTALVRGIDGAKLKAVLMELAPTWAIQLPGGLRPDSSDLRKDLIDPTPHRMARELCDVLDVVAQTTPLLVVLEDLQWADRATLDLIHALANRRLRTRLIIVATLRSTVTGIEGPSARALASRLSLYRLACEIRLEPLSLRDVESYLLAIANAPAPQALSQHLHDRSEGNPLFMQAMLDLLRQQEQVVLDAQGWRLGPTFDPGMSHAPPSLTEIIQAEIDDLPAEYRQVIEAASLSDGPFSPFGMHVASDLDESAFESLCEALCRRGQIIRRGELAEMPQGRLVRTYRFRHALYREAAYDRQGAQRRVAAHLAVARYLEAVYADNLPALASGLAQHYLKGADWTKAIGFQRISAQTAMQRFAHREAAALLERAMAVSANLPLRQRETMQLGLLEELARIFLGLFDPRAPETYERLALLAKKLGHIDVEARALFGLGYAVSWSDRDRSLHILNQALAKAADIADPVARARIQCKAHGWRNWIQGWNPADVAGVRTAIAELRQLDDPIALHSSLVDHSLILFPAARYGEAIEEVARGFNYLVANAHEASVDLSLPLWITRLGTPWAQMLAGRFGEALTGFAAGFAAFEANGVIGRAATLRVYHAYVLEQLHDHRAALAMLDETIALIETAGIRLTPNDTKIELVVRGLAELGLGRLDDALRHLSAAEREMEAHNTLTSWYWRLAFGWGMTDALMLSGDLERAEACARRFLDGALAIEERGWRALAAESCARLALIRQDHDTVRTYLDEAWAEADGYDLPLVRWRLHAVAAWRAEACGDDAARHWQARDDEIARLANRLPDLHPGRATLAAAAPYLSGDLLPTGLVRRPGSGSENRDCAQNQNTTKS